MPKPGYFQNYQKLHRLASESLMAAIEFKNLKTLDEAEQYARDALSCAHNFYEIVLSQSFLNTVEMERIVFKADSEGRLPDG